MAPTYRIERDRGSKEFPQQRCSGRDGRSHFRQSMRTFARWRWASPAKSRRQWAGRFPIRSACSPGGKWRRSCQAVLSHDQRIGLDGSPAEMVDAEAKELPPDRWRSLRRVKAAKKAAEAAAGTVVKPKPAQTRPTETPEQLRDRACCSLAPARVGDHVLPVYVRDDDLLRDHAGAGLW
jgi:hypothetical protein